MSKAQGIAQSANQGQFKNRIINGDCRIDQRNNGAAQNNIADFTYTVDRWLYQGAASRFNFQQNAGAVTPPAGFTNYLGATVSSAVTLSASDYFRIQQRIEGFNIADLGWGAAGAQTVTVSFWVRSSLTGNFGGSLMNSAGNRSYPFPFTITAANTWEYKTVTIAGDTTGTWVANNGIGVILSFSLGSGSSFTSTANTWGATGAHAPNGSQYVASTAGATFYITGVQLEKGSTATSFDYRPYGTELALCQRYCFNLRSSESSSTYYTYGCGNNLATTRCDVGIPIPVTMRATPSMTTTGTASNYAVYEAVGVVTCSAVPALGGGSSIGTLQVTATTAGTLTAGRGSSLISANNNISYLLLTAEL